MSTVRMFETKQHADAAVDKLVSEGFRRNTMSVITPGGGAERANIDAAVRHGHVPGSDVNACIDALARGRTIIALDAPFGYQGLAYDVLDAAGAVDSDMLPEYSPRNPSPLSDFLGMPTLTAGRTTTQLSKGGTTFSVSLSKKSAPSSSFGMSTLSKPKKNWTTSFGLPMLTKSQGPSFGFKTLSSSQGGWTRSFGLPLLSRNSAPLSSMFGLRVISKSDNANK